MGERLTNMNDNEKEVVQEEQNSGEEEEIVATESEEETKPEKTFTQAELNELVKKRLERERKSIFNRYNVENREALDIMIGKAQSFDTLQERYDALTNENENLRQEMAFIRNHIKDDRRDDVLAYFKGKGLTLDVESLKQEIATHPEWQNEPEPVKQVHTITKIGQEREIPKKSESDDEKINRLFGV